LESRRRAFQVRFDSRLEARERTPKTPKYDA
jgi:hypothetical protein